MNVASKNLRPMEKNQDNTFRGFLPSFPKLSHRKQKSNVFTRKTSRNHMGVSRDNLLHSPDQFASLIKSKSEKRTIYKFLSKRDDRKLSIRRDSNCSGDRSTYTDSLIGLKHSFTPISIEKSPVKRILIRKSSTPNHFLDKKMNLFSNRDDY